MGIDYFGVNTGDKKRVGELVENRTPPADIEPIDVDAMRARLTRARSLRGEPGEPMAAELNAAGLNIRSKWVDGSPALEGAT